MCYVYVYLDPRIPGDFKYGELKFDHQPFYVGKGQNKRDTDHLREAQKKQSHNMFKIRKINRIIEAGFSPIILRVYKNLSHFDANTKEIEIIALIGRSNLKTGPLVNITKGGDGVTGHILSKETKEKISKSKLGKPLSEEHKKNSAAGHRGLTYKNKGIQKLTNKHKEKISKTLCNKYKNGYTQSRESIEKGHQKLFKPIVQYSLSDDFIKQWPSIKSACLALNISQGNLSTCLSGKRKYCGGYKWKLLNE